MKLFQLSNGDLIFFLSMPTAIVLLFLIKELWPTASTEGKPRLTKLGQGVEVIVRIYLTA